MRESKEKKSLKKQLAQNICSPRTYQSKQEQIEKWVSIERKEIKKTKEAFKAEWEKTVQMIEDTQRNVEKMRERLAGES